MKTLLQSTDPDGNQICGICSHRCVLPDGATGRCGVRKNRKGTIESLVYGRLVARSVDPIEKKPFYHIAPGTLSYSIATVGCNFSCRFCQNSGIAQFPKENRGMIAGDFVPAESVVRDAIARDCRTIAYTYNEPAVFYEYVLDTARLAKKEGLKNLIVSNGYLTEDAIDAGADCIDGANIDLKAFTNAFYKKYCGAGIEPVKNTIKKMKDVGIFVEITTLLIPGLNDSPDEIERLAAFISDEVGPETPWHISRFHPSYKMMNGEPTPLKTLLMARDTGIRSGLKYVYTGNVPGQESESTWCPDCGALLIQRVGYRIYSNNLSAGRCPSCHSEIDGVEL